MGRRPDEAALQALSEILYRERELVERLEHDESARFDLHAVELERAITLHLVAEALDLRDDVTLCELATSVPGPWGPILERHRKALAGSGDRALPPSLADFLR